ncbi:MAG: class I SAM-dependent methyltransferase [Terriglobales bacterium]
MGREWNAEAYHRLSEPQYAWGRRVLERLSLRGDETVLDSGCGTARLTVELARLIPRGRVLAVDLSQNMLRQARETFAAAGASVRARVDFACADSAALPFDSAVDGVFSTASFHWVLNHDALFRSVFTALKPGGWLIAQCGGGPNLLGLRRRAEALMKSPEFENYFVGWRQAQNYSTDVETTERLRKAGFRDIATWLHREDVTFPNPETYREFLETVTLHADLARIPDPVLRDRFLDILTEQALSDPQLGLDYWRLNIYARKPD